MTIIRFDGDEFVEGFTQDGGLTPIDIVCDITGLTLEEVRSIADKIDPE